MPRSKVIYNGRTINNFQSGKKEPLIFASGRIWDEGKNLENLCKISKEFKWPLYIAGSGICNDLNGKHLGFLNESEMLVWFNKASIYLHPALYEPFGLSVLEAANCDCALILSEIQSLKEIWEDTAIFVNPLCTDEIITKVSFVIDNMEERLDYAKKSKMKSLAFTTYNMCKEYVKTYINLISHSYNMQNVS
jgi:glycosyltransferase involved in cell wall biosynthesis